jgi:hypothetical protein
MYKGYENTVPAKCAVPLGIRWSELIVYELLHINKIFNIFLYTRYNS